MKKRFIAGASCPECKALDKIVMYSEASVSVYECVACGHKQRENFDEQTPVAAADTSNSSTPSQNVETQPLKFFPMPPKAKE